MGKTIATVALCCLAATSVMAQDPGSPVAIHGFGEWAYVRTDGNDFLDGNEDGDYDTSGLGLNVTTAIGDDLKVVGQLALRSGEEDTPRAELDYAFAQWHFSDALQLRLGRSKHPFGIYTEIFDVGTLRPFFHLPLSLYGPSEIAAQSYNGAGLTGTRPLGAATSIDYDAYVGEVTFGSDQRVDAEGGSEQVRDVIGGRARFNTAVAGLSFGASAYTGTVEAEEEEEEEGGGTGTHRAVGLHAEYAAMPLTIRAEIGRHDEEGEGETTAHYLEASYRISTHFELAGRFDRFESKRDDGAESSEHRDIGLGVNYWFNPNFVVKVSSHRVKGFGVAIPADEDDADDETNALVFGAQFSF